MKKVVVNSIWFTFFYVTASGQTGDTVSTKELTPILIQAVQKREDIQRLQPVYGVHIFSGKKSEVITVGSVNANITERTARQIFSKVPGVFVYDLEGGNQINIATRGLDPHRGWEFNQRKDGALSNSDLYAYPANHFSIPMESVERIEFVRGTGSLQYGAQFGGMLNYIAKQGDTTKPLSFESFTTIGSFNLLSSYNAVGGKSGKIKYYAYVAKRTRDGYRDNEGTTYDAQGLTITYQPVHNVSVRLDWARSNYIYKIPGPLTDSMFLQNPRQATRFRNYYSPTISIPSITVKWTIGANTQLQFISSAVLGDRKSVIYDRPATIRDTINLATARYNQRQVDIDRFNSYTQELRVLHNYKLFTVKNILATGVQLLNNHLHRTQLGKGTTELNYDLTLVDPVWGRNMHFRTNNIALFAENSVSITERFLLNIGARWEAGESKLNGQIVYYPENQIPVSIKRQFPLLGVNFTYRTKANAELYGGFSQTYRPMLFKDIIPSSVFERVDPSIRDANGYNAEIGFRGNYKSIRWDITGFLLQYNNRFGTLALTDSNGDFYTYRTNTGNSRTTGIELFIQGNWSVSRDLNISLYTSTSLMNGIYTSGFQKAGNQNLDLKGRKIESVPAIISRNGFTCDYKKLSLTFLLSYTGETFADPLNTVAPNITGTIGLVPSYTILDVNATLRLSRTIEVRAGVNNVTRKSYFTKRPLFYPGPGVWPSDGRNITSSLVFRI